MYRVKTAGRAKGRKRRLKRKGGFKRLGSRTGVQLYRPVTIAQISRRLEIEQSTILDMIHQSGSEIYASEEIPDLEVLALGKRLNIEDDNRGGVIDFNQVDPDEPPTLRSESGW